MIEVEAKARILDINDIRNKARKIGKYKGKQKKIDDYYTLENLNKYPGKSLRIRKLDRIYQVNFKKSINFKNGIHAKKEVEFKVSDINGFIKLIEDFGYKKWLRKEKETELYEIRKNFHIEINMVKGLGSFIEVEYLADIDKVDKARTEVIGIMKKLGFSGGEFVKKGYTKMLWDNI